MFVLQFCKESSFTSETSLVSVHFLDCFSVLAVCPAGKYGPSCVQSCQCNKTSSSGCNPLNGVCQCRSGFISNGIQCNQSKNLVVEVFNYHHFTLHGNVLDAYCCCTLQHTAMQLLSCQTVLYALAVLSLPGRSMG